MYVGTGCNAAYVEKIDNIEKWTEEDEGEIRCHSQEVWLRHNRPAHTSEPPPVDLIISVSKQQQQTGDKVLHSVAV